MSLLSIVTDFCKRTNITSPTVVLGSADAQIQQVLHLLEEECDDLVSRGDWQVLKNEATHTTLAAEDQGAIDTIASNGFDRIIQNTIWDRDLRLPVYVIDDQDWQQVKAISVTGPRYQARLRGGRLISNPTPTAGHTWAFEYISRNYVIDSGSNYYDSFQDDTDNILFPERLVKMGLRWRWKKEKGFDYAEDFSTYEKALAKILGSEQMRRNLKMDQMQYNAEPRVYVPNGNWNL